jgi:hypothetical protein
MFNTYICYNRYTHISDLPLTFGNQNFVCTAQFFRACYKSCLFCYLIILTAFTYALLYNTDRISNHIELNDRMTNELERIWKEVIIAQLKVLYQQLPGQNEGNNKKPLSK